MDGHADGPGPGPERGARGGSVAGAGEDRGGEVRCPAVTGLSWGRIEVEDPDGRSRTYKDAKLFPGGSRAWDWNETGTSHTPGVQRADVEELLEHGAEVVVVGRGVHERLGVPDDTVRFLEDAGAEVHVLQTEKAVRRYGELRDGGLAVGAVIHSTC